MNLFVHCYQPLDDDEDEHEHDAIAQFTTKKSHWFVLGHYGLHIKKVMILSLNEEYRPSA